MTSNDSDEFADPQRTAVADELKHHFRHLSSVKPIQQVNFPQEFWIDPSTNHLYLTQSEKLDGSDHEDLSISRFNSDRKQGSIMEGLRGKGSPLRAEKEGGSVFLTFLYQHKSGSDTDKGWVRLRFEDGKVWTAREALKHGTTAIPERPPKPLDRKWLQGEVEFEGNLYRLFGGPRGKNGGSGPDAHLQVLRNQVEVDNLPARMLGREGMVTDGNPINQRLEPEGLTVADVGGLPHLIVGIANGERGTFLFNMFSHPLDWATFVGYSDIPASLEPGDNVEIAVTVRNSGLTTWIPDSHCLVAQPANTLWDTTRHDLNAAVLPGKDVTFTFTISAPPVGAQPVHWKMARLRNNQPRPFGEPTPDTTVIVTEPPPKDGAVALPSEGVPSSMLVGTTATVAVVMRNTGTSTWTTAGGYRLAALGLGFNNARQDLPGPVPPGAEVRIVFTIAAPTLPVVSFVWQMIREGHGAFGQPSKVLFITRLEPPLVDDAQFVKTEDVPVSIPSDRTASVVVVMRNSGTTTWTSAEAYRIGAVGHDFGNNRHDLSGPVLPGAEARFVFTIGAPPTPTATFQWQMVRDGHGWFGTPSNPISIQRAEATECAGLRTRIKALQAQLEGLSDELHQAAPHDRPAIVDQIQEVTAERNQASSRIVALGCHR